MDSETRLALGIGVGFLIGVVFGGMAMALCHRGRGRAAQIGPAAAGCVEEKLSPGRVRVGASKAAGLTEVAPAVDKKPKKAGFADGSKKQAGFAGGSGSAKKKAGFADDGSAAKPTRSKKFERRGTGLPNAAERARVVAEQWGDGEACAEGKVQFADGAGAAPTRTAKFERRGTGLPSAEERARMEAEDWEEPSEEGGEEVGEKGGEAGKVTFAEGATEAPPSTKKFERRATGLPSAEERARMEAEDWEEPSDEGREQGGVEDGEADA